MHFLAPKYNTNRYSDIIRTNKILFEYFNISKEEVSTNELNFKNFSNEKYIENIIIGG
ncbi:MAG: hypothetical protein LBH55_01675 [Mycoplasmataceae bacterium]|jgi:hypothetical protein|nr:hypothetical protein [Mycoplasmataceae bacterium]